jgi:hypothetical protein
MNQKENLKKKIVLILFYIMLVKNAESFITEHLILNKYNFERAIYWLNKNKLIRILLARPSNYHYTTSNQLSPSNCLSFSL